MKNISSQIVDILKSAGIKRVYGIPGDTIDTLMESIRVEEDMDFILTRHEANAGFMASGEARLTGRFAVAVACQGPGTNNLLNGLADASRDGVGVLAITGQVDTDLIATDMPQGSSQLQLFGDIAAFNAEARSPHNLIEILHIAINTAMQGGVAHISIPSDIMRSPGVEYKRVPFISAGRSSLTPDRTNLHKAAEALNKAKKVVILYGEGARYAAQNVVKLAQKLQAPLVHTTRSKDIIDNTNPHVMGGIGLMGSHPANEALHACDLLLIIGSNYAYKQFYPDAAVVKIDTDFQHLATHVPVDHPLYGDSLSTTNVLLELIIQKEESVFLGGLRESFFKHLDSFLFSYKKRDPDNLIHPAAVVEEVMHYLDEDGIVCGDSGSATIWINNVARFNGSQRFIWSANLATLGAAFPQAIGAYLATKRQIAVIAGDGGIQFSINDFVTAALYGVPIKCFILNNASFKFIEFEERTHDGNAPSGTKLLNPDFEALAEASFCKGISAKKYNELKSAVKEAFAHNGAVIVDCRVDPDALLIPPAVNAQMAYNYLKSEIKSWFTTDSAVEQKIAQLLEQK